MITRVLMAMMNFSPKEEASIYTVMKPVAGRCLVFGTEIESKWGGFPSALIITVANPILKS